MSYQIPKGTKVKVRLNEGGGEWQPHEMTKDEKFPNPQSIQGNILTFIKQGWLLQVDVNLVHNSQWCSDMCTNKPERWRSMGSKKYPWLEEVTCRQCGRWVGYKKKGV